MRKNCRVLLFAASVTVLQLAVFCKTFLHNNATNKYTTLQPEICL